VKTSSIRKKKKEALSKETSLLSLYTGATGEEILLVHVQAE
jgi:hypothetical protein